MYTDADQWRRFPAGLQAGRNCDPHTRADEDADMDANRITIFYPNAHPNPDPYSHGGYAIRYAYGLDFDARTYTPTDTASDGGTYTHTVKLKVALQRAAHAGAAG